jgi:mandelate racemase
VDRGADRYDNFDGFARLSAELKTPIQIGENFYGSRDLYRGLQVKPAIC